MVKRGNAPYGLPTGAEKNWGSKPNEPQSFSDLNMPKGIHRVWKLPDPSLEAMWNSIIVEDSLKTQLLSQAVLNFTIRGTIRKMVANALASSPETAMDPNRVTVENLIDAAKAAKLNRTGKVLK